MPKDGDVFILKLRLDQLKQWADERDRREQTILILFAQTYHQDWEEWLEGRRN